MKYVIHNVKDSCWNILGDRYFVIVTDPEISATMKPDDYKVRESVSDPMARDFIEKKAFQAMRIDPEKFMNKEDFCHVECISEILEWIRDDIFKRSSERFEIQSYLSL